MSDANPQGTPAPATTAPAPAAAPPPAPAPAPTAPPTEGDPAWMKERLERHERALLTQLGVDSVDKIKAAIEAANKAAEANKSAEQRAAEAATRAQTAQAEADRLKAIATEQAARMLAVLTPEQQAAVKGVAGDDPAAQLKAIQALGPTWKPATPQKQEQPLTPPATTAPPPNAPPPSSTGSPPDHKAVYAQMRTSNPFEAAAYGLSNPSVYDTK